MAFASGERRSKPDKEQQDAERDRLEAALEVGLKTTYPSAVRQRRISSAALFAPTGN